MSGAPDPAAKPAKGALPANEPPAAKRPEDEVEMGFVQHLAELRTRLIYAFAGVLPAMVITWSFKEHILEFLMAPWVLAYHELGLGEPQLHYAAPTDPFVIYLKNSFLAGIVLVSPWIFYQLWAFIAPGLYRREKLIAIPFVLSATVCFIGGVSFGYFIVFPPAFETLMGFGGVLPGQSAAVVPTIMISGYMSFVTRLLLGFGIVFEVPVVVTLLAALGIVDWRGLLKFSRWWVLVATFIAAFLTPPDVGSQLMMLVPLIVLYYVAVFIAWIIGTRRERRAAAL